LVTAKSEAYRMKALVRSSLAVLAVLILVTARANAQFIYSVPEIDPSLGAGALAVLGGAIAMIQARRRK
jgi:hypothetical protein